MYKQIKNLIPDYLLFICLGRIDKKISEDEEGEKYGIGERM